MFAGQDTDRLQGLPEPHVCGFRWKLGERSPGKDETNHRIEYREAGTLPGRRASLFPLAGICVVLP